MKSCSCVKGGHFRNSETLYSFQHHIIFHLGPRQADVRDDGWAAQPAADAEVDEGGGGAHAAKDGQQPQHLGDRVAGLDLLRALQIGFSYFIKHQSHVVGFF